MSRRTLLVVVGIVAAAVYLNAIPLGFALDDDPILRLNPVVTGGDVVGAVTGPYWRMERDLGLLWRPVTMGSFAVEWGLWNGAPAGFHAVNVLVHAAVSVLVAALLLAVLPPVAALLGALVFAVHPVHVEAVANVVGRSELYAAGAFVGGCLLFLWRPAGPGGRAARLVGVAAAYAVGLGSKEIAVTLPGVLALLAVHPATRRDAEDVRADLPLFALLAAVLGAYLVLRMHVLGSLTGEQLPAELIGTTPLERVWTALALWPQYLRLMVFPADLVADYGPGILGPVRGFGAEALGGALVLGGLLALSVLARHRAPVVSLGIAWFMVAVLPVAHLGVHAGVLLAERTLYLPSVGLALAVAGGVRAWREREGRRASGAGDARGARPWPLVVAAAAVLVLLTARTVTRTPVWDSSFTLFRDLAEHHPESHRALRLYGDVLRNAGDLEGSARAFGEAARLHPNRYSVLAEAGAAFDDAGDTARARELLRRAIDVAPRRSLAYRLLAESYLKTGEGRAAHRAAAAGLGGAGSDRELWALLSESYLLRPDLDAAVRARRAALAADPASAPDWERLAAILEMAGDTAAAHDARARAREAGAAAGAS